MRKIILIAAFFSSTASLSAQQPEQASKPEPAAPSVSAQAAEQQPDRVKVYAVGPDVTAPELLPLDPFPVFTDKCKKKMDGSVSLAVIVDSTGKLRKVMLLQLLGNELDQLAAHLVYADRFKPGTRDGVPVAVLQSVKVRMQACTFEKKDDAGRETSWLQLRSQPDQKFGSLSQRSEEETYISLMDMSRDLASEASAVLQIATKATIPILINTVEPRYSEEAKIARLQGICLVELIVDANGMPQNIRVVHPLGKGLDEKAVEAVSQYRFKPAMHNGVPVPVKISVEINFRLY